MPIPQRLYEFASAPRLIAVVLLLLSLLNSARADSEPSDVEQEIPLIGYTEGRNDLEEGQFVNWRTNLACVVRANGTERNVIAQELTGDANTWTQFAGWSPDGQQAVILSLWESPENAAWERDHQTFRMTEGWLVDICLHDMATGTITNLTAVNRVSNYNTGLFFRPDGTGYGFTPLINGVSKPFAMDGDGRNKRDVSGSGSGFAYGYSTSPDGSRISYQENYQVFVSNPDGSEKQKIETGNSFNFIPQWSPDGQWLMFVSGEHYDCHPHIVRQDGTGLRKLADRGGYRGVVERLKHPDFHSESSDLPVWSTDSRSLFFTAQVDASIELMRVDLDGNVTQLTTSEPGTRHYHPAVSPDGKEILFGSDRSGTMQLYVAIIDGMETRAITSVAPGYCAMHGHWQPVVKSPETAPGDPSR
jgi:TolB protein